MFNHLSQTASVSKWKPFFVVLLFFCGLQASFAQADYAIQGASVSPTSVAPGSSLYATGSIYNIGNTAGSSSNIGYYLSTNSTLDASDTFIGSSTGGTLNANGSSSRYTYLTIPASTATGSYYLLYVADYLNSVAESNENNNVSSVSIAVVPSRVDFTISSAYLSATSVSAGSAIYVEGSISNQGNIASTSSNVGYYLSTNTTLESSDIFIGSYTGYSISPGYSTSFYSNVTIPAGTAPGTYNIIFVADYLNTVTEGSETNNTLSRQFTVITPSVDLTILQPSISSTTLSPGNSTSVNCYIYNQGNTIATSSNVGYYLSTNTTLDATDVFIGTSSGSSLSATYSSYRSATITIPANTAVGSYYILYAADYLKTVTETNENNNVSSVAISVVTPYVDLYLQSAYLNTTSATPGASVYGEFYIRNSGNTTATSSNVGVYLSANSTFDASDVFIGSSTGGSIASGGYSYRSPSFTIPSNTAAGNYYVFFVADYLKTVTESNENNNTISMALSVVLPYIDLALESAAVTTTSVSAGNPISATSTVRNTGNTSSASSNMGYYLSPDNILDAKDVLIGFANGAAISAGYYDYKNTSVTIPANTTPGNYYLIQAVDYLKSVTESNENNNTGSSYISVTAQGTSFVMPVNGNSSFTTCTGKIYDNGGTGNYAYSTSNGVVTLNPATSGNKIQLTFNSFSLSYYDYLEIYDGTTTSATLIGRYASSTNPGVITASNSSGALTLRFYGSGYYSSYAGFEADIACVTPAVDLMLLSAFTSSNSMSPGTSFSATSFIANTGTTSSHSSSVGYYLSANATFESTDLYLGNSTGGTLTSGNSAQRVNTLFLPNNVTAGTYNILFVADATGEVDETDEDNNLRAVPITVTSSNSIDLTVTARTLAATTIAAGGKTTSTGTIKNSGNVAAPKSMVGFYLSSNTTMEAEDVLLGFGQTAGTLAAGASEVVSASLEIPSTTKAGSYYVLVVPDHENHIAESNEANGMMSVALTVTNSSVDFVVQTPALSVTSVLVGGTVTATSSLKNQGTITASSSNLGYYLSTNNTFEASDVALGTTTGGSLAAATAASKSASLTIPAGTAAGSYFVLFVADPAKAVTESNEDNNVVSVALTVVAPTVDLVLQTSALSANPVISGNTVTASTTIKNAGTVAASASTVTFYLSSNNTYEAADVLLGTATGGSLEANGTATRSATLTIPASTATGNYYILLVADKANAVAESNENNNLAAVAIALIFPTIDLVVQQPVLSSTEVLIGGTLSVNATIANTGNMPAASSTVGYYLSANATFEASDVALGNSPGAALAAGATAQKTATLTIPANTPSGSYYLLLVADHAGAVAESNESNNVVGFKLTVLAPVVDLVVQNATVSPASAVVGSTVMVNSAIINNGTIAATSSAVGYYLSVNNTYESTDVALGTSPGPTLPAGAAASKLTSLTIPAGTAAGNYFILFMADPNKAVSESNENNNLQAVALTLTAQPVLLADLVVTTTSPLNAGSVIAGGSIQVAGTVVNQGDAASAASKVTYYLSDNLLWDAADSNLGETAIAGLAKGGSAPFSRSLTIPAGTPFKEYYILMIADAAGLISEKNEANNMDSVRLTVKDPNGIKELSAEHKLSLWPNPATEKLTIEATGFKNGEKIADITIYSATGQKVATQKAAITNRDLSTTLAVAHLNHGLYLVYIKVGDTLTVRRILVQK